MSIWELVEQQGLEVVTEIGDYDYSWSELRVYYQSSSRRFFWYSDSGCSCGTYGEFVDDMGEFEHGDKSAALRAVEAFWSSIDGIPYGTTKDEYLKAKEAVRNVKVAK